MVAEGIMEQRYAPLTASISFPSTDRHHLCCISVNPVYILIPFLHIHKFKSAPSITTKTEKTLGNKFFSTSLFTYLNKSSFKILCNTSTAFLLSSSASDSS